ncbi:MAG: hypothetical protein LBI41_03160 [Lactobacillales bacterium]|jgi:hypothetical protein|nr:hypothetical protein [Lactobacillales bacterium]
MKKFLIGLMLSCVAMFSFSVVGNCMTQQTIESAYLPISESSWLKSEVEQQAQGNRYITLKRDWYQKVMVPSKVIVEKKPSTAADGSPILVRKVLQEPRDFNLSIPIEDGFLGPQIASFNVKLKNSNKKSIEEIVDETVKPKEVMEVIFMNIGGSGTIYEEKIDQIERELAEGGADPLHINSVDVKIIPFNTGVRSYGYIFTPSLDVPLENALIYFICGGHKNNQFDNLNTFLDSYWEGQELRARALGFYCPR